VQVQTILVVDDEDALRALVRDILALNGYTVLDTSDPKEALWTAMQQTIHLLLTDVGMPFMKGTELAHRLQALRPQTKVLLMSGNLVSEVTAARYPFIPKPFTPDALAEKVRQVLAQPSPLTPARP
jgi:two-component system, cell cycle sensor histidine kinase and response regulator CckA